MTSEDSSQEEKKEEKKNKKILQKMDSMEVQRTPIEDASDSDKMVDLIEAKIKNIDLDH